MQCTDICSSNEGGGGGGGGKPVIEVYVYSGFCYYPQYILYYEFSGNTTTVETPEAIYIYIYYTGVCGMDPWIEPPWGCGSDYAANLTIDYSGNNMINW